MSRRHAAFIEDHDALAPYRDLFRDLFDLDEPDASPDIAPRTEHRPPRREPRANGDTTLFYLPKSSRRYAVKVSSTRGEPRAVRQKSE